MQILFAILTTTILVTLMMTGNSSIVRLRQQEAKTKRQMMVLSSLEDLSQVVRRAYDNAQFTGGVCAAGTQLSTYGAVQLCWPIANNGCVALNNNYTACPSTVQSLTYQPFSRGQSMFAAFVAGMNVKAAYGDPMTPIQSGASDSAGIKLKAPVCDPTNFCVSCDDNSTCWTVIFCVDRGGTTADCDPSKRVAQTFAIRKDSGGSTPPPTGPPGLPGGPYTITIPDQCKSSYANGGCTLKFNLLQYLGEQNPSLDVTKLTIDKVNFKNFHYWGKYTPKYCGADQWTTALKEKNVGDTTLTGYMTYGGKKGSMTKYTVNRETGETTAQASAWGWGSVGGRGCISEVVAEVYVK